MAKMTLLEMVADILNDTDSDSVNSITDTTESQQVAAIVRTAYGKLVTSRDDWPFLKTKTSLTGLGDTDNPTKMRLPTGTNKTFWIKYNAKDVTFLSPKDFTDLIDAREEQADVIDASGYGLASDPTYWTTYDDDYVFFDGRDSDTDTTLQESKAVMYGIVIPSWTHTDGFIPTLPEKMFPTLLADAKSTAFLVLKQQANPKEEAFAKAGRARAQHSAYRANHATHATNTGVDFGRK